MTHAIPPEEAATIRSPPHASPPLSVVTRLTLQAPQDKVWDGLVFYEEIGRRPPPHLRMLLPVPIRTDGRVTEVGGEAVCLYESGQLLKRVTRIAPGESYEFEVAEQNLAVGGGVRLCGGRYALDPVGDGRTELSVETRYTSTRWPRWLCEPIERVVCHWFHRYLLHAIRRAVESR